MKSTSSVRSRGFLVAEVTPEENKATQWATKESKRSLNCVAQRRAAGEPGARAIGVSARVVQWWHEAPCVSGSDEAGTWQHARPHHVAQHRCHQGDARGVGTTACNSNKSRAPIPKGMLGFETKGQSDIKVSNLKIPRCMTCTRIVCRCQRTVACVSSS